MGSGNHWQFVADDYLELVQARSEFEVRLLECEGEAVNVACRGARYGLNRTFFDPAKQIARMDALGIDRTVVSLATPLVNYYLDPALATQAARLCNDGFAALVAAHPKRFAAWAFLPMQHPQTAAAELRRCVREHG